MSLELKLGITYDENLDQDPKINCSLPANNGGLCLVTYEDLTPENSLALKCNHTFHKEAWYDYLKGSVEEGPHGIEANCMQHGCNVKVGHTVFETILA